MAPICVGQTLTVCARLLGQRRGIYQLEAWLMSGLHIAGQPIAEAPRLARASAKFIVPAPGVWLMTADVQITVVCDNHAPAVLQAEHGLAFWIQSPTGSLLLDTGSGETLIPNAASLSIP